MALFPNANTDLFTIYKEWYREKGVENLLYRNSPLLKEAHKIKVGGKYYVYPMMYTRGGQVSGDMLMAQNILNVGGLGAQTQQARVPYAKIFSSFYINEAEILAGANVRGAFTPPAVVKMFAATDALRKTFAAGAYGLGYGELGQLPTAVNAAATTMTLNFDTIIKMDVGTMFYVTTSADPSSALIGSTGTVGNTQSTTTAFTVTNIVGNTVTFSPQAPGGGFAQYAWIELLGGRDAAGNPNMQTGLRGWLPAHYNRTGGNWNTYIGTTFFNLTRNLVPDRMAGAFYLQGTVTGGEPRIAAIKYGVQYARRGGGVPNMIVMNDATLAAILEEIRANTTYFQAINNGDKGSSNEVVVGLQQTDFQFSTSWIKYVIEDPYCPLGIIYILDKDAMEFVHLSNADRPANDGIAANEPGRAQVDSETAPDFTFKLMIDELINIQPASTSDGPAAQINLSLYGNWALTNPANCSVVKTTDINASQF